MLRLFHKYVNTLSANSQSGLITLGGANINVMRMENL